MSACNDYYENKNVNIYEHLYYNEIKNFKAITVLCLEDIWIIRLLFNGYIKNSYSKKYETSKRTTNHIIIDNINEWTIDI